LVPLTLLFGCPSVEKDPAVDVSANTIAIFAPNTEDPCLGVVPFPTDLIKDPVTGTLNVPFCHDDTPDLIGIKTGLRTMGGYSVETGLTANFSAALDPATLAAGMTVLNTSTNQPHQMAALFISQQNMLAAVPVTPFTQNTTYLVALTTALKDATGGEVIADQAFTFLKSEEPLVDQWGYSRYPALDDTTATGLEQVRVAYEGIWAGLAAAGIARDTVVLAWSFTTQDTTAHVRTMAEQIKADLPTIAYENTIAAGDHPLLAAAGIPVANVCKVHTGRVLVHDMIGENGYIGFLPNGAPATHDTPVDYILLTPNPWPTVCAMTGAQGGQTACDANPSCDWNGTACVSTVDCSGVNPDQWNFENLVVFGHALGKCKNVALTLADSFGRANWAVLAMDGPRAGSRSLGNLGDQDLDTCPDQPATPELITIGDALPDAWALRDNLQEWGFELMQAAAVAKVDARQFAAMAPAGAAVPVDRLSFVGHSWGGMAAIIAGAYSGDAETVAVTATSGDMLGIFTPVLQAGIAEQLIAAGMSPTSSEFQAELASQTQEVANIFQWVLAPVDGSFSALEYPVAADLPVLVQVVSAGTNNVVKDAALHGTATQRALAAAFATKGNDDPDAVTFKLECNDGGVLQPICADDMGVVGSPLIPCVDATDPRFALAYAKTVELQTQLVSFVAMAGSVYPAAPTTTPDCP
jgi:pimeloyl-ACP methyl ester carboxylesterase